MNSSLLQPKKFCRWITLSRCIVQLHPSKSGRSVAFVQICIFSINMYDIIFCTAWWWENGVLKCRLIKHTCLWCDKLISLWTLNRQVKICEQPPSLVSLNFYKCYINHRESKLFFFCHCSSVCFCQNRVVLEFFMVDREDILHNTL